MGDRAPRLVQPDKPVQNAFIEAFISKLRDECLNEHVFRDLTEARQIIAAWRHDYNWFRPHSSLGALTPREFADQRGDGPLEQVWGSADRPLAPSPKRGKTSTHPTYKCGARWGAGHLHYSITNRKLR